MVKKVKKTKISNVKAEATGVKQVVNVRVGGQYTSKKKTVRNVRRRPLSSQAREEVRGIGAFERPPAPVVSLSTQTFQPPSYVNEYNALLRELADERRARNQSVPPLAPNTAPLTTNQQRNELLSRPTQVAPFEPAIQAYATLVVDKELADDPLTNENVTGFGSARLAENIAQKLPVAYFDEEDIDDYDDENQIEQSELIDQVEGSEGKPSRQYSQNPKKAKVQKMYEGYVSYIDDVNAQYGLDIKPRPIRDVQSQSKITEQINKIDEIVKRKKG